MEIVKDAAPTGYRVKLINLADYAQAVWHVRDETYLELKLYGFNSQNEPVQFVAPFAFENEGKRNEVFQDDAKLIDFANAVFVTQMATIDPDLNTEKFKTI
jgi:hypothetical protein